MTFIDYGISDDCININTYGELCVKCGCCKNNPNYRDMIRRRINYYKDGLNEELNYLGKRRVFDLEPWERSTAYSNILYYKRRIRLYKKIMRTMKGSGT